MAAAIETDDLTKDFLVGFWRPRPYPALHGLTMQVEQGEVFGFLGPNGAGKSTAIKLLMQLIFPTSGHARILGRPVGDLGVRRRLGYFARLFGMPAADRRARVTTVLDEVGLGKERRLRLRSYSKGMVQRVGI